MVKALREAALRAIVEKLHKRVAKLEAEIIDLKARNRALEKERGPKTKIELPDLGEVLRRVRARVGDESGDKGAG